MLMLLGRRCWHVQWCWGTIPGATHTHTEAERSTARIHVHTLEWRSHQLTWIVFDNAVRSPRWCRSVKRIVPERFRLAPGT